MFLLSRDTILKHGYLTSHIKIGDMEIENLIKTFYYFRLGEMKIVSPEDKMIDLEQTGTGILPAGGYAYVKTIEHFHLGPQIFGILGNLTDLVKKGAQIIHSPFTDPGFEGRLFFGLRNNTNREIALDYSEKIGKISFFNIVDTNFGLEDLGNAPMIAEKMKRRKEGGDF